MGLHIETATSGARGQYAVDMSPSCFLNGFLNLDMISNVTMSGNNNFLQAVQCSFLFHFDFRRRFILYNGKWVENTNYPTTLDLPGCVMSKQKARR
jgi:hypothetical protein